MKASIFVTALLLASALGFSPRALPQDTQKEHSMIGCLEQIDGGSYQLTHLEKGPRSVAIAESKPDLDTHIGQKIEITGTAVPGVGRIHTMKVTAIKVISPTCP
jgi:hypothetical protein